MFASKAGAKMVIGIDMSNILDQAEKIVRSNGFTEDRESIPQHTSGASVLQRVVIIVVAVVERMCRVHRTEYAGVHHGAWGESTESGLITRNRPIKG
jgi:hypothetical protein